MPRDPDAPSRMEVLVLSTLARRPMHGYEIKLELRYKHVRWWAKCEHGHLYSALARLERNGCVEQVRAEGGARARRVFAITRAGLARLTQALERLGAAEDSTYFDVDLFLAGAFALDHRRVLELLAARAASLRRQLADAEEVGRASSPYIPAAGRLIVEHRIGHLAREVEFTERAAEALRAEAAWGSYLGTQSIRDFIERTGAPLEPDRPAAPNRRRARGGAGRTARSRR